ncbi:putative acid phosphatase [Neospora caninum Liverpool]|uniref:acid phosphatase n=1 Tax=Neospora caninum (strain Liverpool) TaxID=572307 RepID=F0VPP5_NEOCL|nr:putative acid phosphatase [Neospora caninum Liverpool]CBZ55692.1 putative acid phosphatase [Neospora caninum Liverpool]CEL70434.1 TPA: acid phosphatase, putative [Neospora caninum Liverpool]|eukprot:XP_003885718.1 putative acid phosphatase [Neospora caninum Liverpool]
MASAPVAAAPAASSRSAGSVEKAVRSRPTLALLFPVFSLCVILGILSAPSSVDAQLKFVGLGNWGYGTTSQKTVADTLKKVAAAEHISFIASPGSNFAGGVSGMNDTKWQTEFENVYSDPNGALKMPFFTVLGVDDWSGNYTSEALRTELTYAATSEQIKEGKLAPSDASEAAAAAENTGYPKWTLPNWWYHYLMHFPANTGGAFINSGHKDMSVGMIFIDTWVLSSSFPFSNVTSRAWEDLEKTLELAPKILDYIIVVADRPVYSSGASKGDSMLQYYLQPLLKKANIDAYISGYDFSLEVISDDNISHVSCGAGAKAAGSAIVKHSGSLYYGSETGFCLFELTAEGLVTRLVSGTTGETLYTHKQPLKNRPERKSIDAFNFVSQLPEVRYYPVPEMGKMPGRDVFVRVVGTIGLCIATIFLSLSVASGVSRYMK